MARVPKMVAEEHQKQLSENEKKWGPELVAAGWTFMPTTLINRHRELGLDAVDLAIVLVLASRWWTAGNLPFPSKKTIGRTVGIDESNVRKRLKRMEDKNLIVREMQRVEKNRNKPSRYDLRPLIDKALPYAKEELKAKEAAQAASAAKAPKPKKKPNLELVP